MNEGQMEQLQIELTDIQTYFKNLSKTYPRDVRATIYTTWANTIGTIRVLLDVFRDEWAQTVLKGEPGVETPPDTPGTHGSVPPHAPGRDTDFNEVDYF